MRKSTRSIQIPAPIAVALEAFAKANHTTESEVIVDILKAVLGNSLFKPYIQAGSFDQQRYRADLKRTGQAIDQWHKAHPDEVANLRKAGAAGRRRVSHSKDG